MTAVEAFAPAKINLSLHVTGQRADGYHLLDSLVVFANVGDRLTVKLTGYSRLTVNGPKAAGVPTGPENLVLKAASWAGVPATFKLEKNLPAAAGIGGGSSDAAAALRALSALTRTEFGTGMEALGADVPACFFGRACRMRGIGEQLNPMHGLPGLPVVLVNPGVEVATPDVFKSLARSQAGEFGNPMPEHLPELSSVDDVAAFLSKETRNDLETPAIALQPVIGKVLDKLASQSGAELVRMSGSGATCFALFRDMQAAESAALVLGAQNQDWWVQPAWLA